MPERLSLATVAACAALAAAAFGGAYALAHDEPAAPAPEPASPTAIRLERHPIGELHRVRSLPALIVPRPKPAPEPVVTTPEPVVTTPKAATPVAPVVTPTPTPPPAPTPPAPAPQPAPEKKPLTFDDSG